MKTLIAVLIMLNVSLADAKAVWVTKATPAPYAGYLLDQATTVYVNTKIAENEAMSAALDSQVDMMVNIQHQKLELESQVSILKEQNASKNFWQKTLYFIGGVLIGGAISELRR